MLMMRRRLVWAGLMLATAATAFAAQPGVRVIPSGGLRGESAALALRGQQGGTLQFELLPVAVAPDGEAGVPIYLEVLGADLLENTEGKARLEVALYAISDAGALGASLLRVVEIDTAAHGAKLASSGLKLAARLPLGAGRWTLRAFVRSLAPEGRVSLRIVPLVIESDPANTTVTAPLVLEDSSRWIVAGLDQGGEALIAASTELPAARPLVVAGSRLTAQVVTHRLNPRARIDVRIVTADGAEVANRRLEGSQRLRAPAVGVEIAKGEIDLAGVPEGELQLQVQVHTPQDMQAGRAGESFGSTALSVAVAGGTLPSNVSTWAEAFGGGSTQLAPPAEAEDTSRSARLAIPREELGRELRAALGLLATGRELDARTALIELETRALAGSGGAVPALAKAELQVCRDLAKRDPEALIPVALLWLDIYRAERARRGFLISTHARAMVANAADLYVEAAGNEGARRLAARIHAILGAELQAVGLSRMAGTALERSLTLDPSNELAALALATELERRGATADTLGRLQALVTADPAHREANLRLGVAEVRLGRERSARERLGRLVEAGGPADWIFLIAAQELVRLEIGEKRYDAAAAAAARALEVDPANEKLLLSVALLDDLQGRSRDARAKIERIPRAGQGGAGERARYGEPPREALARSERELRESADPRRERLAASLGLSSSQRRPLDSEVAL
jgi:tetratricopeptide (TPR) repeat protein